MAEDLRDSLGRLRVTPQIDAWLEAESRATGASKHEIARSVLHAKAVERFHVSTLLVRLWPREGSEGTGEGQGGQA